MRTATQNEIFFFQENGYIILEDVIPFHLLIALKKTLEKLIDHYYCKHIISYQKYLTIDEKIIALKNFDPNVISIIQRIISRTPEFFSISSHCDVVSLMRELYQLTPDSPFYVINNGIVFTCPHDVANSSISNFHTEWHNDVFYTIPNSRFCQVWIPVLNEATPNIGSLIVCPGSQKAGIGKQKINLAANFNNRFTIDADTLTQYTPLSIEVKYGGMMIFDSRLIHRSGNNHSNLVRCTILGAYHDALTEEFSPVSFEYKYYKKTPEGYFYELFKDENAKKVMFEDLAADDLSLKIGV